MRLAVSGSSKCGKSTLVNDLAQAMNLEIIPEFLGSPFRGKHQLRPEQFKDMLNKVLLAKSEKESTLPNGFVSDRCPIDLAYFWLNTPLTKAFPEKARNFFTACKQQCQQYDAVIIPPGPSPELGNSNAFEKPEQIWTMLHNHSAMIGLAFQWLPADKVFLIPSDMQTPDQRLAWVLENCISSGRV